jgi:hypothetical protein
MVLACQVIDFSGEGSFYPTTLIVWLQQPSQPILIPVPVTGIQPTRVSEAKESFSAQRLGLGLDLCDIPRASPRTEMREAVVYARRLSSTPVGEEEKSWSWLAKS